MSHRRSLRIVLPLIVTMVSLAAVVALLDPQDVASAFQRLELGLLIGVVASLLAGIFLASIRLKQIASDLGYYISPAESVRILSVGQLAAGAFFQVVGQTIARGMMLSSHGVPVSANLLMAGYERLLAALVSFGMAIVGAWYLFGRVALDLKAGGADFLKLTFGGLMVLSAVAIFVWGRSAIEPTKAVLRSGCVMRILRTALLSLLIQLTTMVAYIIVATKLDPTVRLDQLCAALALVMLAAALPISFAGWGVRELSAVYALGVIGLDPEVAVIVAATIGVVGVIVLLVVALLTSAKRANEHLPLRPTQENQIRVDYDSLMVWCTPILAASAVLFQVYIPAGTTNLNVNLADPFAVVGGVLFASHGWRAGRLPDWRVRYLYPTLAFLTVVLSLALLHGWVQFGWTSWAFVNRYLGWFILLGYLCTGAVLSSIERAAGLNLLLRTYVISTAAIVALELLLILMRLFGMPLFDPPLYGRIGGFSADPNAFALQICFAVAAVLVAFERGKTYLLTLLLVGLWFTGSRSGAVSMGCVLTVAVLRIPESRIAIAKVLAFAALIIWGAVVVIDVIDAVLRFLASWRHMSSLHALGTKVSASIHKALLAPIRGTGGTTISNLEWWLTISLGFEMFKSHPAFGAGLGAFMVTEAHRFGRPLVIHSTPIWLLAEFGVLGAAGFFLAAAYLFIREVWIGVHDKVSDLVLMLLVGFGATALAHDLLYQRAFWLLLGCALGLRRVFPNDAIREEASRTNAGSTPQLVSAIAARLTSGASPRCGQAVSPVKSPPTR